MESGRNQEYSTRSLLLFAEITAQWEQFARTPRTLTFSRQVHLVKENKVKDNLVRTAGLRPINVFNQWSGFWTSTWSRSRVFQEWRSRALPPEIAGSAGSPGTEQLASRLADMQEHHGWLASLAYSLAFDRIDPSAATTGMLQLGLPAGLCNALACHWRHQRKIFQWRQDTCPEPISTDAAVPQGDTLSVLAMNVYMYAGLQYVSTTVPSTAQRRLQSIFYG